MSDFKCSKCGYEWDRKSKWKEDFEPKECPRCKSRYWKKKEVKNAKK